MVFWIVIFLMGMFVAGYLLLAARSAQSGNISAFEYDQAYYTQRLVEIDRDLAAGVLDADGSGLAKAEEARKLIKAQQSSTANDQTIIVSGSRIPFIVIALFIPVFSLALYAMIGNPQFAATNLNTQNADNARDQSLAGQSLPELLKAAEKRLIEKPSDAQGWLVVAPVYLRIGRYDDAINAYQNVIKLLGRKPGFLVGLAEAMVLKADGVVTEEARLLFSEVVTLGPENISARFYLGLAAFQSGNVAQAKAIWESMTKDAKGDEPWFASVKARLAELENKNPTAIAPELEEEDLAIADGLDAQEQRALINEMVASLAGRLKTNPQNKKGWERLIRSYIVLGEKNKSVDAINTAMNNFPNDVEFIKKLEILKLEIEKSSGQAGATE